MNTTVHRNRRALRRWTDSPPTLSTPELTRKLRAERKQSQETEARLEIICAERKERSREVFELYLDAFFALLDLRNGAEITDEMLSMIREAEGV